MSGSITLEGSLERITYLNEENGYVIARLEVPGKRDLVTIVGNLGSISPGETLRLHGQWTLHKKYGEQFQVERYETLMPATLSGVERYLGSGLIKGIGPVYANRIVDAFGLETFRVIDEQPARLREVEGIGEIRLGKITQAWQEQKEIREVMIFLQSHGVSATFGIKIFKVYKDQAIAILRGNPYQLAQDIEGIGFKTADRIAQSLGVAKDSPARIESGVLYILGKWVDAGHVYVPSVHLAKEAQELLESDETIVDQALHNLREKERIVILEIPEEHYLAIYLIPLSIAEQNVAKRLTELAYAQHFPITIDPERALTWVEQVNRLRLAPQQRQAIKMALTEKLLIITGGPGTGKTTILKCLIEILEKKGVKILLAAPTGRAAKRMEEATARQAKTIHRLLEFSPKGGGFQRNQERPLQADLIILDEASMIDLLLMNHLLKAVPLQATLLLVGDIDQLPSVGPGQVLRDIIDAGVVPVIRLTDVFRQGEESLIPLNAHKINEGLLPTLKAPELGTHCDFYFWECSDPEEMMEQVKKLVSDRIPQTFHIDPVEDIQVLSPMHKGNLGVSILNQELQALLNPVGGKEVTRVGRLFRVRDKVMQLKNNYEKEVYNGDVGRILGIDSEEQEVKVNFEGRIVSYEFHELDELSLAYAVTVHKSQGSEYPAVILLLHTSHYTMLQRNLLYTAITRARKLLILIGTKKALAVAVKNNKIQERFSHLKTRLMEIAHLPSGINIPIGPVSSIIK
ncbi:MAG: SF1B family DNA helicase RecD2 [Nitrospiria bacterium]